MAALQAVVPVAEGPEQHRYTTPPRSEGESASRCRPPRARSTGGWRGWFRAFRRGNRAAPGECCCELCTRRSRNGNILIVAPDLGGGTRDICGCAARSGFLVFPHVGRDGDTLRPKDGGTPGRILPAAIYPLTTGHRVGRLVTDKGACYGRHRMHSRPGRQRADLRCHLVTGRRGWRGHR
jgi:hypothetical protein